jgi:ribose transport system ATP-binding protein
LRRGEVFGIAGLLGSGRTELLRAIFGLDQIKAGTVKMCRLSGWQDPASWWRAGAGMVSEDRKSEGLALDMSIADNLVLPCIDKLTGGSLFVSPNMKEQATRSWIEKLSIKCAGPSAPISSLSGGNQQKVAFARLLQSDVDVLLLDEPTRGVDVKTKEQIYRLIDQLATNGKTILLISSYLPELLGTCDRVAFMHRGKLSEPKDAAGLKEEDLLLSIVGSS